MSQRNAYKGTEATAGKRTDTAATRRKRTANGPFQPFSHRNLCRDNRKASRVPR